uniref:Uncharacterized protein n=1 Tax=Oryza brachyantha TaxID=4533 RepID=J3LX38_ORYBR
MATSANIRPLGPWQTLVNIKENLKIMTKIGLILGKELLGYQCLQKDWKSNCIGSWKG